MRERGACSARDARQHLTHRNHGGGFNSGQGKTLASRQCNGRTGLSERIDGARLHHMGLQPLESQRACAWQRVDVYFEPGHGAVGYHRLAFRVTAAEAARSVVQYLSHQALR